jgi:hypothetical protein
MKYPAFAALACCFALLAGAGCSSSSTPTGPVGGAVSGPQDTHCSLPDGGVMAQVVDLSTCHEAVADAGAPDYGDTQYNSVSNDDDCKYNVGFTNTPVYRNYNVTFTVTASTLTDGKPATGEAISAEVFLSSSHPAPNSGQETTEVGGGKYTVGPIQFDAAGQWTVRFHLHEECQDATPDSPHGHVAFYIAVP